GAATPTYDAAGNMTFDGTRHYAFDAWNHLVATHADDTSGGGHDAGGLIAGYEYDGRGYRTAKTVARRENAEAPEEITGYDRTDYYYNDNWQVLEERQATNISDPQSPAPDTHVQYLWDQRYVDALVCRWRDTTGDGVIDETLYYAQDANWNVTALVNPAGQVVERYVYSPYGERIVLNGEVDAAGADTSASQWQSRASNTFGNEIANSGYRLDPETDNNQVRNVYFRPPLGVSLSRDPNGYGDGNNLGDMINSNPINRTDAMGLDDGVHDVSFLPVPRTVTIYTRDPFRSQTQVQSRTSLLEDPKLRSEYEREYATAARGMAMCHMKSPENILTYEQWVWRRWYAEADDEDYDPGSKQLAQRAAGGVAIFWNIASWLPMKLMGKEPVLQREADEAVDFAEASGDPLMQAGNFGGQLAGYTALLIEIYAGARGGAAIARPIYAAAVPAVAGAVNYTRAMGFEAWNRFASFFRSAPVRGYASGEAQVLSRGAQLRTAYGEQFGEYMHFRGQGFTPGQAKYLTQPYDGWGHHFLPRRWDLPEIISESPLNVMKPEGISIGRFYERHYFADLNWKGTAFPDAIGGSWSGKAIGLQRPGLPGRLWYGSPAALKVTAGGAAAAGAGGLWWWMSNDDE
ncbi:MAG: hypothetical protein PHU85_12755, partial [Phycisphaerae bacterium]|nr:hypothetical protein [Phycisphaerae bacterium]